MVYARSPSYQDRPIEAEAADRLDRGPFVDSLARALIFDEFNDKGERVGRQATGYVLGLTGRWGLGKSSVLNLLAQKLGSMDGVAVALFNPWLFNGRDELVSGFFNTLRDAMGRTPAEVARGLVGSVDSYWEAIEAAGHGVAAVVDFHGGSGIATAGWKTWAPRLRGFFKKPKQLTPHQERRALERKIAKSKCAIVVLIDELDRVEDKDVRAVAQVVKAVGDIKGLSYLVAYDTDRVIQALGRGEGEERRRSGQLYLEKIIQHAVPLRPLFTEDTKALLEAALFDYGIALEPPSSDSQRALLEHLINVIETPREVKRLVSAFSVLQRAVQGEICPYDVLGYCWILTKSPSVRDQMAVHIDDLAIDPGETKMLERAARIMANQADPDVAEVLNADAIQKKTLELLFPRSLNESEDAGRRLLRRRNLIRMLYLGNPPGMMRRGELEALWSNPAVADLEAELRQLMDDGKLAYTLDRLDDLLPSLPVTGDRTFWVALSRVFVRRSDWLVGPESARALSEDAGMALHRLGLRDPGQAVRLRSVIEALKLDGDLVLVPWILRKHLFAHGLTTHPDGPRGGEVLKKQEIEDLLARELPRYRSAVLGGTALRRLPTLEAVYVIINAGYWDNDIRASFTAQLDTLEAISTLAGLLVPPGFTTNLAAVNELLDADQLRTTIEALVTASLTPSEPWLAESFRRLRSILTGHDPSFQ